MDADVLRDTRLIFLGLAGRYVVGSSLRMEIKQRRPYLYGSKSKSSSVRVISTEESRRS